MTFHPYHPQPYHPGYPAYPPRRTSAPFSVHFVAFLIYLGGLFVLLGALAVGVLSLGATQLPTTELPQQARNVLTGVGLVVAVVLLLVSFLYFLIGRKLQRGRQWARVLVLIFCVLGILGTVANILLLLQAEAPVSMLVSTGASLIGPLLFLILLNTSAARSWFRFQTY